jgi:hypothetical protein
MGSTLKTLRSSGLWELLQLAPSLHLLYYVGLAVGKPFVQPYLHSMTARFSVPVTSVISPSRQVLKSYAQYYLSLS